MPTKKHSRFTHDIATVGAAVLDEYAASDRMTIQHVAHATVERHVCVPLGAKLGLSSLLVGLGGGAANSAVTCARLGLRTATLCRVGKDLFGEHLLDLLRNQGVDIRHAQRDTKHPTAKSLVLKTSTGERTILVYRGASKYLDLGKIPVSHIRPRWFYLTSLSGNINGLHTLFEYAEHVGARIAWNPGMSDLALGLRRLMPFMKRTDLFIVNREEAAFLAGKAPRHLPRVFHELGPLPKIGLLVSDGANGTYLKTEAGTWHYPALSGKRVDTTGAGDALGSATVAGFIHTCDLPDAVRIGMMNALAVIRRPGATEGSLTRFPTAAALRRIRSKQIEGGKK